MGSACCTDNRTAIEKQIDMDLFMLKRMPNMKSYALSTGRCMTFTKAWANPIFGGTVFLPLGAIGKKRNRKNLLEENIRGA